MDHTVIGNGPSNVRVHQYISHPVHKFGYQRLLMECSSKVPWFPPQIHPNRNGVSGHLNTRSHLPICCQNRTKIQAEE